MQLNSVAGRRDRVSARSSVKASAIRWLVAGWGSSDERRG